MAGTSTTSTSSNTMADTTSSASTEHNNDHGKPLMATHVFLNQDAKSFFEFARSNDSSEREDSSRASLYMGDEIDSDSDDSNDSDGSDLATDDSASEFDLDEADLRAIVNAVAVVEGTEPDDDSDHIVSSDVVQHDNHKLDEPTSDEIVRSSDSVKRERPKRDELSTCSEHAKHERSVPKCFARRIDSLSGSEHGTKATKGIAAEKQPAKSHMLPPRNASDGRLRKMRKPFDAAQRTRSVSCKRSGDSASRRMRQSTSPRPTRPSRGHGETKGSYKSRSKSREHGSPRTEQTKTRASGGSRRRRTVRTDQTYEGKASPRPRSSSLNKVPRLATSSRPSEGRESANRRRRADRTNESPKGRGSRPRSSSMTKFPGPETSNRRKPSVSPVRGGTSPMPRTRARGGTRKSFNSRMAGQLASRLDDMAQLDGTEEEEEEEEEVDIPDISCDMAQEQEKPLETEEVMFEKSMAVLTSGFLATTKIVSKSTGKIGKEVVKGTNGIVNATGMVVSKSTGIGKDVMMGTVHATGMVVSKSTGIGKDVMMGTVHATGMVVSKSTGIGKDVMMGTVHATGKVVSKSTGIGKDVMMGTVHATGKVVSKSTGIGKDVMKGTVNVTGNIVKKTGKVVVKGTGKAVSETGKIVGDVSKLLSGESEGAESTEDDQSRSTMHLLSTAAA
ncbi:expressed unknown protein [Seminavis robusta]|uniref:Uncharacterized protein n=1 Tax=Seminavis robusta TaxID=568900 RepID=A0A9N8HSF8_9STRA|nr:expressed unknown protein [Seminavis robusta]|eukprot:Sro1164_g248020.1 n/a (673) ;mRNA; f:14603-16621